MDCSTLGMLVVNHEPIELIDVRSKNEFAAMHIPGARSIPFGELAAPGIFRRRQLTTERVYVISADGHARASLATAMLRSVGCVNAVPVDGGMKDWVARGFPVRPERFSLRVPTSLIAGATLIAAAWQSRYTRRWLPLFSSRLPDFSFSKRIFFANRRTGKGQVRTFARYQSPPHA